MAFFSKFKWKVAIENKKLPKADRAYIKLQLYFQTKITEKRVWWNYPEWLNFTRDQNNPSEVIIKLF